MKKTKIYLLVIMILSSSLIVFITPSTVYADRTYHFTFRVPVELNNIPSTLSSWRIWIHISGPADSKIGDKYVRFSVSKNFNGTKVIRFDADRGKNPRDAMRFIVQLQVLNGGRWQNACGVIKSGGVFERDTSKPVRCQEDKYITR